MAIRRSFEERARRLGLPNVREEIFEGVTHWRGKKIIPLLEWKKIANTTQAFSQGIEHQKTREALQYFPNDYHHFPLFPLGVELELVNDTNAWWLQYIELMKYKGNPAYEADTTDPRFSEEEFEQDYEESEEEQKEEDDDKKSAERRNETHHGGHDRP
jgi:hypothetical protein